MKPHFVWLIIVQDQFNSRNSELRRKCILLNHEPEQHMEIFIARTKKTVKELADAGKIVDDVEIAFLPELYENVVINLHALEDKKFALAEQGEVR